MKKRGGLGVIGAYKSMKDSYGRKEVLKGFLYKQSPGQAFSAQEVLEKTFISL